MVSIGDLSQSIMLKRQNTAAKADLQRLTTMLTSGRVADAATHLNGNFGPLAGLDASIVRLGGYREVTSEAASRAAAVQGVIGLVDATASQIGPAMLVAGLLGAGSDMAGISMQASDALAQVVGAMNTRVADRSLLAGVATDMPAMVNAAALVAQAKAVVSGATGVSGIEAALQGWLDDPAGFGAQAYGGGAAAQPMSVAEGEAVRLDVTATDPALKATLKGLLMGALLAEGVLAGQPQARADLARRAGESLAESAADRAHLSARIGQAEARIAAAVARNAAEVSTLTLARNEMVGVDGYDTASTLQETQTRLEMLYTLTARLSRLNLSDYL